MPTTKLNLKFILERQIPQIANTILKENNRSGGLILSDVMFTIKTINTFGLQIKIDKDINGKEQRAQIEIHIIMSKLIFDKGTKAVQSIKNSVSNKWSWNNWLSLSEMNRKLSQSRQRSSTQTHTLHLLQKLIQDVSLT